MINRLRVLRVYLYIVRTHRTGVGRLAQSRLFCVRGRWQVSKCSKLTGTRGTRYRLVTVNIYRAFLPLRVATCVLHCLLFAVTNMLIKSRASDAVIEIYRLTSLYGRYQVLYKVPWWWYTCSSDGSINCST